MSQPLSEERALEILQQIVDKNNDKKKIMIELDAVLGKLCGISAEIGELTAQLKPVAA